MQPFEQIVVRHGPTVLRVCRAVLGPVDADDAWSETFLSALTAYPLLPPGANIEAWLVTIAHRKAIDVRRAEARLPIPIDQLPEHPAPEHPRDWTDLWNALAQLSRKQREAVAYHHLVGLPFKDIAQITGSTTDAARKAASDGIASLRVSLSAGLATKGNSK